MIRERLVALSTIVFVISMAAAVLFVNPAVAQDVRLQTTTTYSR